MKMEKCTMNKEGSRLLENIDYTKWQRQRFDNMSSDEFQEEAVSFAKENPFFIKE